MKRGKRILVLCLAVIMMSMAACSPNNQSKEASSEGAAEKTVEQATKETIADKKDEPKGKLVFWDKSEYIKEYNDIMREKVEQFGKENNIEVDYVVIPPNDLKQKIMAAIEAKNVPDLIMGDDMLCAQFITMDQIAEVGDIVSKINFIPAAQNQAKVSGKDMLVPLGFLAPGMYIRKDKWDEKGLSIPTTWEELKEQAKIVNDPKNGFYALGFSMGASGGGDAEGMMRALALSFGSVPVDENENITVNSPETLEALKFASSFYQEGLTPPDAITWDDGGNNAAYLAGTVGIAINSGSIWSAMQNEKPDLLEKSQIIAIPKGPSGRNYVVGGGNVLAVLKAGKNVDNAKKFIEYFFNDVQGYQNLVEKMGGMWQPVLEGLDNNEFWNDPLNKGWLENSKSIVRTYYPAPANEFGNQAFSNQLYVKAVQKIVVNKMDPQKALDELEADFKSVYGK